MGNAPCSAYPLTANDNMNFFTLFSKCFSAFVHTTCSLSNSRQYLAFAEVHLRVYTALSNCVTFGTRKGSGQGTVETYGTIALYGGTSQNASSTVPRPSNQVRALQFHGFRILPPWIPRVGQSFIRFTRCYFGYNGCCIFLRLMICLSSARAPALQRWLFGKIQRISSCWCSWNNPAAPLREVRHSFHY